MQIGQPVEALEQGGLSATGWSEQHRYFVTGDVQVDMLQNRSTAGQYIYIADLHNI
jgi:hypothetical protein